MPVGEAGSVVEGSAVRVSGCIWTGCCRIQDPTNTAKPESGIINFASEEVNSIDRVEVMQSVSLWCNL